MLGSISLKMQDENLRVLLECNVFTYSLSIEEYCVFTNMYSISESKTQWFCISAKLKTSPPRILTLFTAIWCFFTCLSMRCRLWESEKTFPHPNGLLPFNTKIFLKNIWDVFLITRIKLSRQPISRRTIRFYTKPQNNENVPKHHLLKFFWAIRCDSVIFWGN